MNSRRRIASPKVRDKSSYRATPMRAHKITIKRQAISALGQKQTCALQKAMSALPPKATAKADIANVMSALHPIADMCGATRDVR
jgi:hypothetical protein